jgi:hypothetical protein
MSTAMLKIFTQASSSSSVRLVNATPPLLRGLIV